MLRTRAVMDPGVDPVPIEALTRCWLDVSNHGGAVGFPFLPVSYDEVALAVRELIETVSNRAAVLFIAELDDELVGWVLLRFNASELTSHWATLLRLQTHPEKQRLGVGSALLKAAVEYSTALGLEHLQLVARGGQGLETFYKRHGWEEIGRHPAALRLSKNDTRDEVLMMRNTQRPDSR